MAFRFRITRPGYGRADPRLVAFNAHEAYPNVPFLNPADYPGWPTSVTVLAGNRSATYTVTHNLGYYPIYDLFYIDGNGRLIKIPGKGTEASPTSAVRVSEDTNSITIRLGRLSSAFASDTAFQLYHWIYYNPNG